MRRYILADRGKPLRGLAAILLFLLLGAGRAAAMPWHIQKDHWTAEDERGFGAFVQAIGETNCSSSESCLRNAANPYRDTDQGFVDIDVDCAKLPYLLRAYYAWKNGLPFSYVDGVHGAGDGRYSKEGNRATGRHDILDHGSGIDAPRTIADLLQTVYSGSYRMSAEESGPIVSDFYAPAIKPGSIRPGTVIYDTNGHVAIVYKVDEDGRIYYMDAHPDFGITRSVYGAQFGQSPIRLGGGFKNWRPFRLAGARRNADGDLIGGHIVYAQNSEIPDFSLVQYVGTEPDPSKDVTKVHFAYDGEPLGFYEYVRVAVSGGKTSYNPVYELEATMQSLCNDLKDREQSVEQATAERVDRKPHPSHLPGDVFDSNDTIWESYATPARDTRMRAAFVQFYRDLGNMIQLWLNRDPRIVYDGNFLKRDLKDAYERESQACTITYLNSDQHPVHLTFDDITRRVFLMSFDPYDCVELRWGATGEERATCSDDADKLKWYEAEQRLRDEITQSHNAPTTVTPADRYAAADPPPVDIKSLIDNMGEQVSFQGMAPVGH